jgi:hypothetical protein
LPRSPIAPLHRAHQQRGLWLSEAIRRRDEIRSGTVRSIEGEKVLAEARNFSKRILPI